MISDTTILATRGSQPLLFSSSNNELRLKVVPWEADPFNCTKLTPLIAVLQHDTFAHNTRTQLKQVFEAIRQLMTPPDPPRRPIGFVTPEEKKDA